MFATTPEPPYTAVVFTSRRTGEDGAAYAATAAEMGRLAAEQPGYLGAESVHDATTGAGITVSYWRSDADARAWKAVAQHAAARRLGRTRWYDGYQLRVATVTRAYSWDAADGPAEPAGA